jgi:hypothetical protein
MRVCIGERFAWMEGVLLLATVALKWRFKLVPGHPVETSALITLRAKHGMKMVAEERLAVPDYHESFNRTPTASALRRHHSNPAKSNATIK